MKEGDEEARLSIRMDGRHYFGPQGMAIRSSRGFSSTIETRMDGRHKSNSVCCGLFSVVYKVLNIFTTSAQMKGVGDKSALYEFLRFRH